MSKINAIQTDFTAGEISLKCMGRVDLARYTHAAEKQFNMLISPQGGTFRRTGSVYVAEVPNSANYSRLIEFRFSTTDAVVLELSNNLIRFYKDQGLVLSGGTPYSITSPYATADIPLIKVTQSADIIYLFHPKYPTQVLSRFSDTNWTIVNMPLVDGPYLGFNYVNGLTLAANTGIAVTGLTSGLPGNVGTATASTAIFVSTDVGRAIRFYNGSPTVTSTGVYYATITGYTSPTVVTITVGQGSSVTNQNYVLWALGAICATLGYPSCGTFFQQRLVMANTPAQPQTFFMSQTGNFYNFGPSNYSGVTVDSNGIAYTIASNQVNSILWMSPSAILLLGTDGAEWQVASSSVNSAPVSPTNIDVTLQTGNGSQPTSRPVRVGWETVFVARTGRDVFKMVYEFQINGFQAKSLSLLGEHIPRTGLSLTDMAYQQFPYSTLWFPRSADGSLAGLTYLAEQDVTGWHLHTLGGQWLGNTNVNQRTGVTYTNAFVESIAVIPTPDGTKDQLWMIVKRTINGVTRRFVEYFNPPFDNSDTPNTQMCFLDCSSTYSGAPTKTLSGLSYLQGETVSILADGSVVDPQVVSPTGTITLAVAASNIVVGYAYKSTLKVVRLEGGGSAGTGQGKLKRINKVVVRFYQTLGAEWSADGTTYYSIPFRDAADPMGKAPPLFTGDLPVQMDLPTRFEGQYYFQQEQPYPMTILALMPEALVNQ